MRFLGLTQWCRSREDLRRWSANSTENSKLSTVWEASGRSLSPRERAGVRGNSGDDSSDAMPETEMRPLSDISGQRPGQTVSRFMVPTELDRIGLLRRLVVCACGW
jgi:hypothetical protein